MDGSAVWDGMSEAEKYDHIGTGYSSLRRPDPRWIRRIEQELVGQRNVKCALPERQLLGYSAYHRGCRGQALADHNL